METEKGCSWRQRKGDREIKCAPYKILDHRNPENSYKRSNNV